MLIGTGKLFVVKVELTAKYFLKNQIRKTTKTINHYYNHKCGLEKALTLYSTQGPLDAFEK